MKRLNLYEREFRASYDAVGDSKLREETQYPFDVREGYSYSKVWVEVLKDSDEIQCIISRHMPNKEIEEITAFFIKPKQTVTKVLSTSPGRYAIRFKSSGQIKVKFNVRVGTNRKTLES